MLRVEIRVKGHIDETWSEWFEDLTVVHEEREITQLSGRVTDQSALYSLITRLSHLGLALLYVKVGYLPENTTH